MSLQTFLSKLWVGIKSLFASLPAEIKTAIHIGVLVTENLKAFVDSPLADVLTAIIPGQVDDVVKTLLRAELPGLLIKLRLVDASWQTADPALIFSKAAAAFKELDPSVQPGILHNLSILIAQMLSDGKLTWSDGVYVLQWYYKTQFKAAA